ncbi:MCP four helix bundle domain-containing protein [Nitrososphaera sp.]|uniref:MCP four helix bundle domain-containing protein n=1 Tax=Nitrososphaera sp. TaxID=1971748 RepID=UPI00307D0949
MQTKTALVLSFVMISLIPVSLLSVISFISLLKLEQNISNMYYGAVNIVSNLSDGHKALLDMRLDVGRYISAGDDPQKREEVLASIHRDESTFLQTLIMYKEIDDFPLQSGILERRGLGNLTLYEDSLLAQANSNWLEYQRERDTVIALASQGMEEEATVHSNTVAAEKFSELADSYSLIVDLNNRLARIMYEESQSVVAQAITYASLSAVSSVVFAVTAALLISKRLAPSVDEIQRNARKKIEMFITEGRLQQQQQQQSSAAEAAQPAPMPLQQQKEAAFAAAGPDSQALLLAEKGPLILLHSSGYEGARKKGSDGSGGTGGRPGDRLLDYYLSSPLRKEEEGASPEKKWNLVLITKRSSNLYPLGKSAGATMYVLSSSSQEPVSTSADGLLVISITQTSLILEAVRRTLGENPRSVIIIDNITEMIHKLGFDRAFSLVQSMSDVASQYLDSKIVILINEHAHPPNEVEAIATVCNAFVR